LLPRFDIRGQDETSDIAIAALGLDFFLARGLSWSGASLDDEEFLETLIVPLDEGLEWIRRGTITEPKTIPGLLWAGRLRARRWPEA